MASSKDNTNISNDKKLNINKEETEVAILSILEKSYYNNELPEENFEIPKKLLKEEKSKIESDNNITLFNALYNSLINKDHKSFLFCIQQNNDTLIEETVKQMNNDCLGKFIEKSLDIFQSNSFYTKNILPWMQKIIKFQKIHILTKNNIENLRKIQIYIQDKIKCFNNLCLLKQKMNKINEIFGPDREKKDGSTNTFLKNNDKDVDAKNNDKPFFFEPLLTYYESDDEEEVKENEIKKNKMEIEGFEEINNENKEEEDEEMEEENEKEESEEDYLDEEIDNMDIDENKFKNKKINKTGIKELDDEEEENEDDNEEEDD
jgi:hypothetical protein